MTNLPNQNFTAPCPQCGTVSNRYSYRENPDTSAGANPDVLDFECLRCGCHWLAPIPAEAVDTTPRQPEPAAKGLSPFYYLYVQRKRRKHRRERNPD